MFRMNSILFLIILSGILMLPVSAYCQDEEDEKKIPVNIDLIQTSLLPRSGAPLELVWEMSWHGKGVMDGKFEVEIFDDFNNRATYRQEIALTSDVKRFKTFHSCMSADEYNQQLAVYPRVIYQGKTYPLGEYPFRVGSNTVRNFMIGYASDWRGSKKMQYQILTERNMKFEKFDPFVDDKKCFTSSEILEEDDIYVNPIRLCRFDIVVVDPHVITYLRERQWKSLLGWVSAGGSLWIRFSSEENIKQMEMLDKILDEAGKDRFPIDENGRILNKDPNSFRVIKRDLGRIWIDVVSNVQDLESWPEEKWNQRSAFLWKFREFLMPQLISQGKWIDLDIDNIIKKRKKELEERRKKQRESQPSNQFNQFNNSFGGYDYAEGSPNYWELEEERERAKTISHNLRMQPPVWLSEATRVLMPESISTPPAWLLLSLALGYFMIIGPGDYFILGMFKKRWLTWISFPIVTILFTVLLVNIAHSYMQSDREKNELVINDIASNGNIVRSTEIELLLSSTFQTITTPVREGLYSNLKGDSIMDNYKRPYNRRNLAFNNYDNVFMNNNELGFEGYFPVDYNVSQEVSQWKPEIICLTSLPLDKAGPEFDWETLSQAVFENNDSEITEKVKKMWGEQSGFIIVHGRNTHHEIPKSLKQISNLVRMFSSSSINKSHLSRIVSRLSPSGAPNLEDIGIIDELDMDEYCLIVIHPDDSGVQVYRKLYRKETDAAIPSEKTDQDQ